MQRREANLFSGRQTLSSTYIRKLVGKFFSAPPIVQVPQWDIFSRKECKKKDLGDVQKLVVKCAQGPVSRKPRKLFGPAKP